MLSFLYKKEYQKATKDLKDLLKRKNTRHDPLYYAAQISKSYPHVNPKKLVKMIQKEEIKPDILPKAGAGQDGTDELVKTYMKDTPGQSYKKFRDYIK
jgi:hypothetical protein